MPGLNSKDFTHQFNVENALLSKRNLNLAYLQVYRNRGVGGVDVVQVDELKFILETRGHELKSQI